MKKKCTAQIMISVMAAAFIMILACFVNIDVMAFICYITVGVIASYIVYKIKNTGLN